MKDYLQLLRLNNLIFIAIILGVMEKWVVHPIMLHYQLTEPLTWWMLLLLILATIFIAAGGYVINDYFDVKIDSINHPDDLIVTRSVSKQQAMYLFMGLTGVGIACGLALSWVLHSSALLTTFIFVPGILWFYSASYKRQFLVGNLTIAFLAGLTPLLVAFAADASLHREFGEDSLLGQYLINQIYVYVGAFGGFAFLCTLCREIIKDIEDQEGDREMECHTFPVKYGNVVSCIVVTILLLGIMALMTYINFWGLPISFSWGNFASRFYLLMMIGFAGELALLWSARLASDYRHAQQLMKVLMFFGTMYAFCIPAML